MFTMPCGLNQVIRSNLLVLIENRYQDDNQEKLYHENTLTHSQIDILPSFPIAKLYAFTIPRTIHNRTSVLIKLHLCNPADVFKIPSINRCDLFYYMQVCDFNVLLLLFSMCKSSKFFKSSISSISISDSIHPDILSAFCPILDRCNSFSLVKFPIGFKSAI